MTKIALWIRVCADDWAAESAIKATNVETPGNHTCDLNCSVRGRVSSSRTRFWTLPNQWRIQDFPEGGREPSRGGVNTPNFPENCMKSKEFGRPGGACVPHAPLDPPMRTLIRKCLCSPIPRLIQAVNAVHPICIKNQYENNNILGVDTSELRFRSVQNLVLELGTCPRTEPFRIHNQTSNNAGKIWI